LGSPRLDAETGRWTSKDPILSGGGDTSFFRAMLFLMI